MNNDTQFVDTLRAVAESRIMLRVSNGVTVSRSMLVKAADEITRLRAEHAAKDARIAELERERDEIEARAVALFWAVPGDMLCGDIRKRRDRAVALQSVEPRIAKLEAALREVADIDGCHSRGNGMYVDGPCAEIANTTLSKGISPETQAQLDAIDANIRETAIKSSTIFVGSKGGSHAG